IVANTPPIGRGGHAHDPAKYSAEIALVTESHLLTDAGHRLVGPGQHRLRAFDAEVVVISDKRQASHTLEEAHEMGLAHAADPRRFPDLDRVAAVFAEIAEQRAQPLEILLLALVSFDGTSIGRVLVY